MLRPVPAEHHGERYDGGGGVYARLLAAHPPLQINANFGYTAGLIERLLRSHQTAPVPQCSSSTSYPPSPPPSPNGSVSGLRARGGFTVDFTWSAGRLTTARITSLPGHPFLLRHADATTAPLPAGETFVFSQ